MGFYESARAVAGATGGGAVDWTAVAAAARAATPPGNLAVPTAEREDYAADVRDARDRVGAVAGVDFEVPATVELQDRHHWIDANVATFRRILAPLDDYPDALPGVARRANTASMTVSLSFLARNVLGQYDPLLLAERPEEHGLYFVHPNVVRVAESLDTDRERFRRWIAFHEVTHAAEFGAAPWLQDHLEGHIAEGVEALAERDLDAAAFKELMTTMTAVEGYAELLMDRAFDREYADLRAKLEARRRGGDPLTRLLRRLLGLGMKRRQYERGKAFFETVVDRTDLRTAGLVWVGPQNLPSDAELDEPELWLQRVVR
jgi:uncharacterized protein (DUF2342 family)